MRLCFGSYLAVLVLCKASGVDNKDLCEALLHSVAPNFEFTFAGVENPNRVREDATSKLLRCVQNVSADVIKPARSADPEAVATYFRNEIEEKLLDGNRRKDIIMALKDIIANDPIERTNNRTFGIDDDTVVDIVNGTTKRALAAQTDFCLSSFLAGVFLFVVRNTNNRSGKASINLVTVEYTQSFVNHANEIRLIDEGAVKNAALLKAAKVGLFDAEFANDFTAIVVDKFVSPSKEAQEMAATVLVEARGNCHNCGTFLGVPLRKKIPTDNVEIVYLRTEDFPEPCYENAVALCKDSCAKEVPLMSADEKVYLLEKKRKSAELVEYLTKINGYKFQREIEAVLREIHKNKNDGSLERVELKNLIPLEDKIQEPYLRDRIDASMTRLYNKVTQICGRLEQEIGFDTKIFGELMKSAQIILSSEMAQRSDITDPQEYVVRLLIENLKTQVGHRYADACEIIVSYLVKRCDLFDAVAKQG